MDLEPPPGGFVIEDDTLEPPPGGFIMKDAPNDEPVITLGRAVMAALQQSMKAASPFQSGPVIEGAKSAAREGAPGAVAGFTGTELPPDASMTARAVEPFADPVTLASMGAGLATGGASILARMAIQAAASGAGAMAKEAGKEAITGDLDPAKIAAEGAKAGSLFAAIEGAFGLTGKGIARATPALKKFGAQLIRSTSGVPEKYGSAVLENPEILSKAHTLAGARALYKETVNEMGGVRTLLQQKTGKVVPGIPDVMTLINDAAAKLPEKTLSLEEALAARQGVSHLLQQAKYGNPEQRANKAALIGLKDELDTFVETGLPGFSKANRVYFEANAREAFESWLPQNKNLSPNVLRTLGALSAAGAGALMEAPRLMLAAVPFSPKITGMGIRAGAAAITPAELSAKFAARIAASKALSGGGGEKLP